MRTNPTLTTTVALVGSLLSQHSNLVAAFSVVRHQQQQYQMGSTKTVLTNRNHIMVARPMSASVESATTTGGFIETELRGKAMKLHTRSQAPREGQAEEKQMEPYTPTHDDYLRFLVDSQHVYKALEEIVQDCDDLAIFRNTGLERVAPLEKDIEFMIQEYQLTRPMVGKPGLEYAEELRRLGKERLIPEFMCHYYNFYFAHTAGGRMIGKQMSALLLNKKTLEFYKWDGDLNKIKDKVKNDIEEMVAKWSREEKDRCVEETAAAFRGGGAVNSYLSGGQSPH